MKINLKNIKASKNLNEIKKQLSTDISNKDIEFYFKNKNVIMLYKDLNKYNSIYEILPNEKDFKIILIETEPYKGHWVAILRYNDIIEQFDSYGLSIDEELDFIPPRKLRQLGQVDDLLTNLILDTMDDNDECIYNADDLQQDNPNISTCGRWCILRCLMLEQMNYTLKDFLEMINEEQEERDNIPLDVLVCQFIKSYDYDDEKNKDYLNFDFNKLDIN